jgi:hypothetical protein
MGARTPKAQAAIASYLPTGSGSDPSPCHRPAPQGRKILGLGQCLVRTIRHFCPELNGWANQLPDTRLQVLVTYHRRFLLWWGLLLFLCKLGSRRQLDYQLADPELLVLANVNRLSECQQQSLPVNKTLSHFLGHVGSEPIAGVRTDCVRRLIRNKVLDGTRLLGRLVFALDGTGYLTFKHRHCAHCLVHKYGSLVYYLHPVLEAKLVDSRGLALSIGTEFIENPMDISHDTPPEVATLSEYEKVKQDCELKAFARLAPQLKAAFPQLRLCASGDSLYACGTSLTLCQQNHWSYVLTFKPGRTPSLWKDFEGLLKLCPNQRLKTHLPDGTHRLYRWVNDLDYQDDQGRRHKVNALLLEEFSGEAKTTFAWLTDFPLRPNTVCAVAEQGGRIRSKIENQGFNLQKNSGLNLEHAYSEEPDVLKAFYYLLQIAHLFLQMFEMGSLLQHLAKEYDCTPLQLFGSLKNLNQRFLECLRFFQLGEEAFASASCQIRLVDSS